MSENDPVQKCRKTATKMSEKSCDDNIPKSQKILEFLTLTGKLLYCKETKSKNWDVDQRVSRKQNPDQFQKILKM